MNAPLPPIWTTGSTEVFKTGTWRSALARHIQAPSPCHRACPVGGEIAEWIGLARAGNLRGAWDVLTRLNPFPAVAGRICHHPCESACNRAGHDEAIAICQLERHVGDAAIAAGWAFEAPVVERSGHVAVLGAGPAGLSAAYQLRRRGWRVTVLEAAAEPGGLMRHGIPSYRLAREVLEAEIGRVRALGVDVRCGDELCTPEAFERLCAAHDAAFVATGAARVKRLPALDYALPGVMDGAAYLAASNAGTPPALGRRVVVIGGGSAALDAARSARRAGHSVTLLALEALEQMPAQREEVAEAVEEGVTLIHGAMLQELQSGPAGLQLRCRSVRFVPGPAHGEFRVEPLEGAGFEFAADAVLSSIGQDAELGIFGTALPRAGALLATDERQFSGRPGVWAGGDVASQARFVTEAIGMGQRAALQIHAHLARITAPVPQSAAVVGLKDIATWYHEAAARAPARFRAPAERVHNHAEVQLGLEEAQALAEAERCFSCGNCTHCDNCVVVCPDLAVRRLNAEAAAGYEVLADYCKGCGLCVRECPSGSMAMLEEAR